jgi:hypothetical protein
VRVLEALLRPAVVTLPPAIQAVFLQNLFKVLTRLAMYAHKERVSVCVCVFMYVCTYVCMYVCVGEREAMGTYLSRTAVTDTDVGGWSYLCVRVYRTEGAEDAFAQGLGLVLTKLPSFTVSTHLEVQERVRPMRTCLSIYVGA